MTLTIAGGTVAALVAADTAAAAGLDVQLLLPRRNVGGGFAPLEVDGHRLDRGLRALELHYEGTGDPPPLALYDPAGAGHRPFVRLVDAYVRGLAGPDLVDLGEPALYWRGQLGAELLTTCDLRGLRAYLTAAEIDAVMREPLTNPSGLFAPGRAEGLADMPFAVASRLQHGSTLHNALIAPLAVKLRPDGARDVPATLRRKLWLPLFHPRSLREAAAGEPMTFRPERPFAGIEPGGTGELVTRLLARIEAAPTATVRRIDGVERIAAGPRPGSVTITPQGEAPIVAEDPILALAPGELFAAAQIPYEADRVTSVLAWVDVAEEDVELMPAFVHVADLAVRVYRLSRGEVRDGRVTVCAELAHDVAMDAAVSVTERALVRLGLVREDADVREIATFSGPTFTAPTFANRDAFTAARAALGELDLAARCIGGVEAFGADSLNEQIMQGLQVGAAAAGTLSLAGPARLAA
jgi:hypothetical protein